jgi:hypothetical protein
MKRKESGIRVGMEVRDQHVSAVAMFVPVVGKTASVLN